MGNPFDPMNIFLVVFAVVAFVRLRSSLAKEQAMRNRSLVGNQHHIKKTVKKVYPIQYKKPKCLSKTF